MTKQAFLAQLADILIAEPQELEPGTLLNRFKGWDSMGKMQVLTLIDTDVGVPVPLNWLADCHTVGHILALVEGNLGQ
jgi:acyl carrier protein